MLRPSRPMMRPFISSCGSCTTETVDSVVDLRGDALDRGGDDVAGALVGLFADALLGLTDETVGLVADLGLGPAA